MEAYDDKRSLIEPLSELKDELKTKLAGPLRAKKACEALVGTGALKELAIIDKHLPPLSDADLSAFGLEEQRLEVVSRLTALQEQLKARTRSAILGGLTGQGLEVSLLTESPLTLLVAPLTVELDLDAAKAKVIYAREVVAECKPDAGSILSSRQQAMDHIRKQALDSPIFFDVALHAYKITLMTRGLQEGERVDLVDLLGPLAVLTRDIGEWRKAPKRGFTPYPRYLLAYQLQRLRRDGVLTHGGLRIELGAATAGSTKNKRDVLFVPTTPTEGQYYLSVRFLPV